jgi:hypothetical protein
MMTRNRDRIVRDLTLSAIADDYENLDIVFGCAEALARRLGLTIGPPEVQRALFDLIGAGLAKAYCVSAGHDFEEIPGLPPPDDLQGWRYGFLITEGGKRLLAASPVRDGEGALREDRLLNEV